MIMNNFRTLFMGELQRMKKYNILAAGMFVSLLWIGVLHFTGIEDVSKIFPLLIFLDATSMAMLLVGVTMFFEKQEGTLKSLLVSPIHKTEYILAKTFANILSNVESLIILYLYSKIFKEININFIGILVGLVLIAFFHSLIGFLIAYGSKDFTAMLMGVMKYAFLFMIPIVLEMIGMITHEGIRKLFYALPTKAAMTLLNATTGGVEAWEIYLSAGYLALGSLALYYNVLRKFDEFALKESGV